MDADSGEIPESMDGKLVVASSSCVAVGTLCAVDGETLAILTDEKIHLQRISGLRRVFSGILATPKKHVDVCTVLLEPILKLSVQNAESKVEIWANSEIEPDTLCVLVT
jgi:hypothetical protein